MDLVNVVVNLFCRKWDEKHEINEDTETNLNPNPTKDFISRRTITGKFN